MGRLSYKKQMSDEVKDIREKNAAYRDNLAIYNFERGDEDEKAAN